MQRRAFLKTTAGAGLTAAPGIAVVAQSANAPAPSPGSMGPDGSGSALDPRELPRVTDAGERRGDMLYRMLGSTGEKVSAHGLGGSHIGKAPVDASLAVKLIQAALDRGINFLDNSWDYNNGQS